MAKRAKDPWLQPSIPMSLAQVSLIMTLCCIGNKVSCQVGTSYQQNHPNHVLSNILGRGTEPSTGYVKASQDTAPSLATPQTGIVFCRHFDTRFAYYFVILYCIGKLALGTFFC